MDSLFSRYRNITVLLFVIFAQIVLMAYQVKNNNDVRIIRIWTVTAVTPIAQAVEDSRSSVAGFFGSYVSLRDVREQNRKMQAQLDSLKMENQFLRNELAVADRVKALSQFEEQTPSKMLAARIIGTGSGATNKVSFVDRGSAAGVEKGMGVVTPDGIVGKVLAAYPTASQVLMVDDPGFAAGVISQKNRVRGILKGVGHGKCQVDYIQNEEKVEVGEVFYTDGEDRIFPQGMPAGKVTSVSPGNNFKQIALDPSGQRNSPEEVLIVLRGVHQPIPETTLPAREVYLGTDPAQEQGKPAGLGIQAPARPMSTDADRLRQRYKDIGDAQNHKFGEGLPGSLPPDFNYKGKPAPPAADPNAPKAATVRPAPKVVTEPPAETPPPPL